ncbi:hypothetical protein [Methylotenera sp. 1P/1]|uniref:hypothetical protein n=1 Tax=Methylotenera sp. 1P/1 TaxID=1131551 RepID=UPI0003725659|nr:hypothetical protein [Methylotenera sp. 1P/1]
MELHSFDEHCLDLLEALPNGHARNYFRSAINHLRLGEKLYPVDSSMGVFRYITAEEEAASGLMQCLKDKGYTNAHNLDPWRHQHKHAVIPMFSAISGYLQTMTTDLGIVIDLSIKELNKVKSVALSVTQTINGNKMTYEPIPPLNFTFTSEGKRLSYKKYLDEFASSKGVKDVVKHIQQTANQRNKILYASPVGYPSQVEVEPYFFTSYQSRVFSMLRAYLLIVPYNEKLPFVQDVLDAFLSMLGKIKLDDIHTEI